MAPADMNTEELPRVLGESHIDETNTFDDSKT